MKSSFHKITGAASFLRSDKLGVFHCNRIFEIFTEMRDVLHKEMWVANGNMVEEDHMLMNLSHISGMRGNRDTKFFGHQAD